MSEFEDAVEQPAERSLGPLARSGWGKTLLWAFVVLGGVYVLNPTFGVDLLPDNLPILGNLDEAAIVLLMVGALRQLGVRLPDMIEQWFQPQAGGRARRLPPTVIDPEE